VPAGSTSVAKSALAELVEHAPLLVGEAVLQLALRARGLGRGERARGRRGAGIRRLPARRSVVQSAGRAVKLKAAVIQDEFAKGGKFQYLLLRYTQALITQISQTAVCNRLHSVEQQLCRWLLLSHDRLNTNELIMTQELIAGMLGVRREGVTVAAGRLQDAGAISYVRGHIKVLDRQRMEETVCECYRVVKDEFERLLG